MNGGTVPQQPDHTEPAPGRSDGARSVQVGNDNNGINSLGNYALNVVYQALAPPSENSMAGKADLLADRVGDFLKREEEQLRLWDPHPLPLRCRPAPSTLANGRDRGLDTWAGAVGPLDLTGRLEDLAAVYEGPRPGRLLVLGQPGSGKTVLIRRFAKAWLEARAPAGEALVPVVFSLGSWDPTSAPLRDWLIDRLERDHPFLAGVGPGGSTWADALVGADRVLAILDGFDEIAEGLRKKALRDLTATTVPLLLTSRLDELKTAVETAKTPMSFAGIELTELTLDDSADYLLPASGTATHGDTDAASSTGWEYVLKRLRDCPGEPACASLLAVLSTPLMVTLARTVHSSGRDPKFLLTDEKLSTPEAIEGHLLDNFVPTAYARFLSNQTATKRRTWNPERAHHWLGYLAAHLRDLDTHDIEWWRLGTTMSLPSRMLVSGVMTGLAIGVMTVLFAGFRISEYVVVNALVNMLGVGLAFGLLHGLMSEANIGGAFEPSRMRIRFRGGAKRVKRNLLPRIRVGLAGGLVFGVVYGLGIAVYAALLDYSRLTVVLILGELILVGLGTGLGTGFVLGLMTGLEADIETESAVDPSDTLNTNRRNVLAQALAIALTVGLGYGILLTVINGFAIGIAQGPVLGLVVAVEVCTLTAWGRWVVLVRIWLPLTGQLPWAVNAFLDDAYQRGVLRRAGAVYQFRHALLRDRLAEVYGQHEQPPTATGDR